MKFLERIITKLYFNFCFAPAPWKSNDEYLYEFAVSNVTDEEAEKVFELFLAIVETFDGYLGGGYTILKGELYGEKVS